jgi:ubiquinone/menaquinone biosynthesis C-methylase UbiE
MTLAMIERAQERCADTPGVEFRVCDATVLPFRAEEFDGVITRLSVHHFEQPTAVLQEVHRVLATDGVLVLGDITCSANADEARLHNALEALRDPSHVQMLNSTPSFTGSSRDNSRNGRRSSPMHVRSNPCAS